MSRKYSRLIEPDADVEQSEVEPTDEQIRAVLRALGRRGGVKGGRARMAGMTAEQRTELARSAARARWGAPRKKGRK